LITQRQLATADKDSNDSDNFAFMYEEKQVDSNLNIFNAEEKMQELLNDTASHDLESRYQKSTRSEFRRNRVQTEQQGRVTTGVNL